MAAALVDVIRVRQEHRLVAQVRLEAAQVALVASLLSAEVLGAMQTLYAVVVGVGAVHHVDYVNHVLMVAVVVVVVVAEAC